MFEEREPRGGDAAEEEEEAEEEEDAEEEINGTSTLFCLRRSLKERCPLKCLYAQRIFGFRCAQRHRRDRWLLFASS